MAGDAVDGRLRGQAAGAGIRRHEQCVGAAHRTGAALPAMAAGVREAEECARPKRQGGLRRHRLWRRAVGEGVRLPLRDRLAP